MSILKENADNLVRQRFDENVTPAELFAKQLEDEVRKIFPDSFVLGDFRGGLGGSVTLTFALGKDKSEWSNSIIHNDPAFHMFMIYDGVSRDGEMSDALVLERSKGGIKVKPPANSYLAMDTHKISYRKVKGDQKKIVDGVKKYFTKLKSELKKVEDNLYNYNLKGKF